MRAGAARPAQPGEARYPPQPAPWRSEGAAAQARRGVGRLRRRQRVVAVDARLGPRWIPGGTAIRARGRLIGLHLGAAEGYQFNSLPTRFLAAAGRQPAPPQASSSLRSAALRTA